MPLLTLEHLYLLLGVIVGFVALRITLDKEHPTRWGSAAFWGIFSFTFLFGDLVPPLVVGYLVLIMVGIAAFNRVRPGSQTEPPKQERELHADRLRGKVFVPALLIPLFTVVGTLTLGKVHLAGKPLVKQDDVTPDLAGTQHLARVHCRHAFDTGAPIRTRSRRQPADASCRLGHHPSAIVGRTGRDFCQSGRWHRGCRLREKLASYPIPAGGRRRVLHRDGAVYDGDGKRLRCFCRHHRGNRPAPHRADARWQPGHHGGDRDVCRLLRYPDDADGCQLQHCAGNAARFKR
jgi:hypothetical protein